MKYTILVLSVFIGLKSQAQEFAPIGAKWHYEVINGVGAQRGFQKYTVDGDTSINNSVYKKIKRNQILFLLLREENNKVYWFHAPTNSDRIFFDRIPTVGDIWNYPYDGLFEVYFPYQGNFTNPVDSIGLRVESVSDTTFNNLPAKKINFSKRLSASEEFTVNQNDLTSAYKTFSPFGFFQTFFLLGSGATLDSSYPIRLRCYEDEYWGLIHFNPEVACDSVWEVTKINEISTEEFKIFPNPASQSFQIQWSEPIISDVFVTLIDAMGKVVFKTTINQNYGSPEIDISNLSNGVYFVQLSNKNQILGHQKLIKQ